MMSVAPVASAGEAAGYYSNSDNYYFLGSLQSLWMGEGAKALGLEGNVRGDDLTAVLEGRLPDGSRLGKEVNGQHVHRPGHDLTFSAPKSVSILALIGNDKEMVEAHNHAVRVAAGYVEKLISARDTKDGVTSIVHTGKMVAAAYTHDTSRNLDPQLHTHLLIANMTEYAGKWKALATDYIHNAGFIETVMKHQVTLGKIYRSALRERVEALGHEVEEVGKHGMWEIMGVPEDVRDEYSSRGREIQGAVGAEATLRSRDVAAKDTRRAKVDPSRMRLMERWLGQMKEKGFDLKAYQESVVPRDAGLRETATHPERDHLAKPVPAGPELASLQTSSTAEKSVDTPAQPAERESQSRQPVPQQIDTLSQPAQTRPEKTPATRSFPAAQLDTEIPRPELTEAVRLAISQLSDSKTRFTFGELMMTTAELSEQLPEIQDIRVAIDAALQRIETQPADRVARSASAALPESAIQETETPVNDIVADWKDRTPEARSRTLIIAQLNADRKAINAGIHATLAARGELGEKAIKVPVLDKITHTRHAFNKTEAWEPGMVVKRGDRYQDVVAVDRNGSTVTVRDEEGKIALVSPKELITGDVQLFRRSEMEVRSGDLLKFTATDREQGQMANQRYTVESVSEEGNIRLKGENGRVTINPEKVRAQQHLDYGWAVTGYGAQGASSDYVIALEGTKDGRKALASRRAFYISASRVKEHVQIYTDGKADWVKAVKTPERDIKTAHDALAPETQRKQAKAIWAMGQPVNKTAIGRAWVRHQGMQDASLTAKIIPATRRFPEPALALPVYDNNGRSAGLALVSLVASPEGRMTQGETRMVMTERARGAVLQRSQSGNTIVASDLTAALDAVRNNPKDGVVWQTGDEPPSAWLLKVSGGTKQDVSPGIVSTLTDEQSVQQLREQMLADLVRNEEASRSRQPESLLAEVPQEEVIRLKPEDINPRKPEPLNPDADVIARVRGEENTDGREIKAAAGVRSELEGADKASGEQSRASRVIADLANAERDMLRAAENTERGRTPEREEQTLTRTIQKER